MNHLPFLSLFPKKILLVQIVAALGLAAPAQADDHMEGDIEEIVVVGTTPVSGVGINADLLPSQVQRVSAEDLEQSQAQSLAEHLRYNLGSVTINEAVNNAYQPDVQYRGFTASPLLGLPQGMSLYLNGVRFNEPFGDTVNWDLLPTDAIASMDLFSGSNPVFGQNTLGGALAVKLKDGFSHKGNELELGAGQFGYRQMQLQSGNHFTLDEDTGEQWGYYVIANKEEEDGWRDHSGSDIKQFLSVLSWRNDDSQLNLTAALDDNEMIGNGAVPMELMDIEGREAIYTHPDRTENRLNYFAIDGEHWVTNTLQVAGNVYYRSNKTTTLNGDDSDYEECDEGGFETLCEEAEDGGDDEPVHFLGYDEDDTLDEIAAATGRDLEADDLDGTVNTSNTRQKSMGFALQASVSDYLAGYDNLMVVGVSMDRADIEFRSRTEFAELRNSTVSDDRGAEGVGLYDAESEVQLDTEVQHLGVFFTDTIQLDDQLSVTVGGRYNQTDIEMNDLIEEGEGSLNGDHSFSRFNPMAGATYAFDDSMSGYASYSEASRAPTPAELSCADEDDPCKLPNGFVSDPPLEQVVTKSIEAGLRGRLESGASNWRWHAGLFHSVNHDDILFQQAGGLPSEGYFANVGKTKRLGTELTLSGGWDSVRVAAAYTWMKATFETPFVSFSPNNPKGANRQVEKGDSIPGLPEHILKLAADWQVLDQLSIGADVQYRGSQYFRGDEANDNEQLDAYSIVNVRAAYKPTQRMEVYARVANVFDKEYETFGVYGEADEVLEGVYDDFDEDRFVGPGAPRTFKAGLKVAF